MASLKKPDRTMKDQAGAASKKKSSQSRGLEQTLKDANGALDASLTDSSGSGFEPSEEPRLRNISLEAIKPADAREKKPVAPAVEAQDQNKSNVGSLEAVSPKDEVLETGERINRAESAETRSLAGGVYIIQPSQKASSESSPSAALNFTISKQSQQLEKSHGYLETAKEATSLGVAEPDGMMFRDHFADIEISRQDREPMAELESETSTGPKLVLSSLLQTPEKDGPKTVTDKIQKKQANAAQAENPVIADSKLDIAQEKAQTKSGSVRGTAKKPVVSQTSGTQKEMNHTVMACGMADEPSVSEPASFEEQGPGSIEAAHEGSSEEKAASSAKQAKAPAPKQSFKQSEFIVYPAHGVGQIIAIEEQEVAGFKLELFVISFVKDKMILKVPTPKAVSVRMRKLADAVVVKKSLDTLTGRARVKRTMWSRRAQEYEAKINSGDLISIAEVVRDLYRSSAQPEQSYSERQLYEAALDRMAREIAAVEKLSEADAFKLLDTQLQKSPRRAKGEEAEEPETDEDGNIEEAA